MEEIKQLILNSNIDFKRLGWITQLEKKLNLCRKTIKKFIKKHMPEFYTGVHKNKLKTTKL